jgi:hypothetical protein
MILLFTLLELIIAMAIAIVLGVALYLIYMLVKAKFGGSSGGGSSSGGPEKYKLQFVTPPPKDGTDVDFSKNTEYTFVVKLTQYNAGSMSYKAYGDQESFVGVVEPSSVIVVNINGSPPGTAITKTGIPVSAYKTKSKTDGTIQITLKGPDPADGRLSVFWVPSSEGLKQAHSEFSITE